jgi:DNA polymerase-3 subunit delta'
VNGLPWQQDIERDVAERLAADRLAHALLVTGPPGWGERTLASRLALRVLGLDPDLDAEQLAHPDFRWIRPDGAVIPVDAVRELAEFAQGTPQAGRRKAAVLQDAHAMNRNAANALLKTLEEPPSGTHLLLVTAMPGRLPATVRSRCQRLSIRPDAAAATQWLAATVPAADLASHSFEHGGAPIAVAEASADGAAPLEPLLFAALSGGNPVTLARALVELDLAGAIGRWMRHVAGLLAGQKRFPSLAKTPPREFARFADELVWVRGQLLASNSVNAQLMAERLLVLWRSLANA